MPMVVTESNSSRKRVRNEIVFRVAKYRMGIARSGEKETGKMWFLLDIWRLKPATVAARSKTCTVFARPNAGTVGSNLT
jgi:hypothetical protein